MPQNYRRVLLATVLAMVLVLFTTSVRATFTVASYNAISLFLQAFPYAIPSLAANWTGAEFCSWSGVTCHNASATAATLVSVNLSGQGLSGSMPNVANTVTSQNLKIVSIDLSMNRGLTGTFNPAWSALEFMTTLDLSSTNLYGAIPDAWNGMQALVNVNISNTYACKNLPSWNIGTLRNVDLTKNQLRGTLAASWGNMVNLNTVALTGNGFCGCVPSTWENVTVLANAASAIGGNLVTSGCGSSNKCGSDNYKCVNAAASPASAVVAAASSLFTLVVAFLSL